jgi:hypothetical protein
MLVLEVSYHDWVQFSVMKAASLALILLLALSSANAQGFGKISRSGNDFLLLCESKPFESSEALACTYYIIGVTDAFDLGAVSAGSLGYSVPPGVTNGQIERIVFKFMKENPKLLNRSTASLILAALRNAYPAKR